MCENVPNWSPAHYWQKKQKKNMKHAKGSSIKDVKVET